MSRVTRQRDPARPSSYFDYYGFVASATRGFESRTFLELAPSWPLSARSDIASTHALFFSRPRYDSPCCAVRSRRPVFRLRPARPRRAHYFDMHIGLAAAAPAVARRGCRGFEPHANHPPSELAQSWPACPSATDALLTLFCPFPGTPFRTSAWPGRSTTRADGFRALPSSYFVCFGCRRPRFDSARVPTWCVWFNGRIPFDFELAPPRPARTHAARLPSPRSRLPHGTFGPSAPHPPRPSPAEPWHALTSHFQS